jgi:hypothetical protein
VEAVTPTSESPTHTLPADEHAEAKMVHIRIALGNWFLYEQQYVKAPRQHHAWTKLKVWMWDIGITGGGFFESVFRRLREGAERRKMALQATKEGETSNQQPSSETDEGTPPNPRIRQQQISIQKNIMPSCLRQAHCPDRRRVSRYSPLRDRL